MWKKKSRNFILLVCGVFLMIILGLSVMKLLVKTSQVVSNEKTGSLDYISYKASKIELSGNGNFVGQTPKLEKTKLSNFRLRFRNYLDRVRYTVSFCNMNDHDTTFSNLWEGEAFCTDSGGLLADCSNIGIKAYLSIGGKRISDGTKIKSGSCVDFVFEATYQDRLANKDIFVVIDEYDIEFIDS